MKVKSLVLGAYGTNCYIVWDENRSDCLVIDPGYEADTVLDTVDALGLKLEAILLTHGHFDHVGAVKEIVAETSCRVFLNPADTAMPPMMTDGPLYYTDAYTGGEELTVAGLKLGVMATPGHTPGSVCLFCGDYLFCGDTLFAGSCGRTDLPGGDSAALKASLKKLNSLTKSYFVCAGHGPSSTLAEEKLRNPYLGGLL